MTPEEREPARPTREQVAQTGFDTWDAAFGKATAAGANPLRSLKWDDWKDGIDGAAWRASADAIDALYAHRLDWLEGRVQALETALQRKEMDTAEAMALVLSHEGHIATLETKLVEVTRNWEGADYDAGLLRADLDERESDIADLVARLAEVEPDAIDMHSLRANVRGTIDEFHEGREPFNQALLRFIGDLRNRLAEVTRERDEARVQRNQYERDAHHATTDAREDIAARDATIADLTRRLGEARNELAGWREGRIESARVAALTDTVARMREALGEDAAGRPLEDLLRLAADELRRRDVSQGYIVECLRFKADEIDAALRDAPPGPSADIGQALKDATERVRPFVEREKRGERWPVDRSHLIAKAIETDDPPSGATGAPPGPAPIPMLLFCPTCGKQHVDAPEPDPKACDGCAPRLCTHCDGTCRIEDGVMHCKHNPSRELRHTCWTNPPHKSHKCHGCGAVWRPADVPTNGVASIATRGDADTWAPPAPEEGGR